MTHLIKKLMTQFIKVNLGKSWAKKLSSLIVEIWWLICSIELSPHLSICVKHFSFKHVDRLLHRVKGFRVNFLTIVKERVFYSLVKVPASFASRGKLWEA